MKAQNANRKKNSYTKSALIIIALLFASMCSKAQDTPFPFKAGSEAMQKFFRDSINISPDLAARKATGTVVLKFSADGNGAISKVVVYYADDISLAQPAIDALNKSNHQWVIPGNRKMFDYIISFTIYFNLPDNASQELKDQFYKFYTQRRQITAANEVPLGQVTLLPNVVVTYDAQ